MDHVQTTLIVVYYVLLYICFVYSYKAIYASFCFFHATSLSFIVSLKSFLYQNGITLFHYHLKYGQTLAYNFLTRKVLLCLGSARNSV